MAKLPPSLFVSSNVRTVNVAVALALGLNEALMLQQVYYWMERSTHHHDGRVWVYNTYDEWQEQFPFWSRNTVRRTIANLEERGCLLTANYNTLKIDNTKWYSIDFGKVERLCKVSSPPAQVEHSQVSKLSTPLPTDYSHKTTTLDNEETIKVTLEKLFPGLTGTALEDAASQYECLGATPAVLRRKHKRLWERWHGTNYTVSAKSLLNQWGKINGEPDIDEADYWGGADYS